MEGTDRETVGAVQRRFSGHEETIDRAYCESQTFRALCHDYVTCLTALDHWREHGRPGPLSRAAEYAELLDELTKEIADHVRTLERQSRGTSAQAAGIRRVVEGAELTETSMRTPVELSDSEVDDIVRRSYQYVAMYNVNNKFAERQGGWNTVRADTRLKDHTLTDIARPNNDTLYVSCLLDLRNDPVILDVPAFDSDYVSLMVTAYDHYVNVPMTTRLGDFRKSETMLFYSARTRGYHGESIAGVDRRFEASGDFVSAVFRVMPHATDPDRFQRVTAQMQSLRLSALAEFQGRTPEPVEPVVSPAVGKTDAEVFGSNLLEVMQFVLNHTTFDPTNDLDRHLLAAYASLGVVPGHVFDAAGVAAIDGARFRSAAERIAAAEMARFTGPDNKEQELLSLFQPKGRMRLDHLVTQSVVGPIGLPAAEALYPPVTTTDGHPMNARHDYVVRLTATELPPAGAFWSVTLYDSRNGFFIPNDRKKYSVGKNAGMKLNDKGGIEIYVAAEQPVGVPEENWLPIVRRDENIDLVLRIYAPDLEKMKTWRAPRAERLELPPVEIS